jgi:uncharacterized protein YjiS (DUF1127 family)
MVLVHSGRRAVDSSGSMPQRWFSWLIDRLQAWHHEAGDRHYLASLNDHNLRDLGLSRHDVDQSLPPRDRIR